MKTKYFVPGIFYRTDMAYQIIVALWCHIRTYIWANISLGNALLPDGTKPLPEPIQINQWGCVAFIGGQFHKYRETSNIRRTMVGNYTVDLSDVVGASPVGAAPTTSSFST